MIYVVLFMMKMEGPVKINEISISNAPAAVITALMMISEESWKWITYPITGISLNKTNIPTNPTINSGTPPANITIIGTDEVYLIRIMFSFSMCLSPCTISQYESEWVECTLVNIQWIVTLKGLVITPPINMTMMSAPNTDPNTAPITTGSNGTAPVIQI
jgi:hypothetical protein